MGLNFYSAFLTEKKERAGLEMLAEHAKLDDPDGRRRCSGTGNGF